MAISNFSQLLTDRQITVSQISVMTNITPSTLYRLRDVKYIKNINMLVSGKICKALNCKFEELYTIE